VGKLKNTGVELSVSGAPIRGATWGLDLGLNVTTNNSKVDDLGGIPPFSAGGAAWVQEGYPVPALRTRWVRNGDKVYKNAAGAEADPIQCTAAAAVADPSIPCIDNFFIHGPTQPTLTWSPTSTLRGPGGASLSARGEFRGGHFMTQNVTSGGVQRSGWMDVCIPWYVSPYEGSWTNYAGPTPQNNFAFKPGTPTLFRAMCNPSLANSGYNVAPADFFVLRSVALDVPLGFAFPDRISNATLNLSLNNAWYWFNDKWQILTPEVGGANSLVQTPDRGVPPTYSVNVSLRIQM
jgi:hypothetical protein